MKSIKYTGSLLAVLLLLLGGCIREDLGNSKGVNPPAPEGSGFISLSINAATTRDAETTTMGTEWENNINAVRVILYDKPTDGSEPTVQYAFHFNITTNADPAPSSYDYFLDGGLYVNGAYIPGNALYLDSRTSEDRFITFAQPVKRQDYQMLVIVNPTFRVTEGGEGPEIRGVATMDDTDPPPTVADMEADFYSDLDINIYARTRCGEPLSAMTEYIRPNRTQILGHGGLADNTHIGMGNFLMTNEQDLIQISAIDIPSTRDQAHASPYEVGVDRIVAKIIVGVENEPDNYLSPIPTPEGAVFCNVEYIVDHQNKTTYWLRNMAWLRNGYQSKMEERGDGSDRGDRYAFTPNFNGLVNLGGGSATDRYTGNYDFYLPSLYPPFLDIESLKDEDFEQLGTIAGNDRYKYVLENTVSPERYAAGERFYTRVLIRGNYVPEGIEVTGGVIPSYYTYNEMVITQAQMDIYAERVKEIASEVGAVDSDGIIEQLELFPYTHADEPEGMPGLFRALFLILYDGLLSEPRASSYDYLGGAIAFDATDGYGLAAYRDGVSYFSVPIKHFGDTGGGKEEDYGYYGVVRNNIYTVIINSISGPGSPTPAGSSSHISAGIKITPWGRVGREINIGEEKPVFAYVRYEYYIEGNTTDAVKTDYDYSLPVGAAIPINPAVLNRYKTYVNSLGQGTFGNGQLVSGSASRVAAGANVVKVMYSPITGMEQSQPPTIDKITKNTQYDEDPTWITGWGVPWSTITLTIKGESFQLPIYGEGTWITRVPDMEIDEEVSATQTEPGKLESERVYARVEPDV